MYLNYFRASSPWTEVEERAWSQPWEMRTFPLTDEEVKELEVFIFFAHITRSTVSFHFIRTRTD